MSGITLRLGIIIINKTVLDCKDLTILGSNVHKEIAKAGNIHWGNVVIQL